MKQFFKIVLFFIFFNISIFAANKIVIGSFEDSASANRHLKNILNSLNKNETILQIQDEYNLYFSVRQSERYHMVVFEPFEDYKVLKIALKEIKKLRTDAYYSFIKVKDTSSEKKFTLHVKEKEKKNIEKIPEKTPQTIVPIQREIPLEKIQKKLEIATTENIKVKEKTDYSIYALFGMALFVFAFYWFTRDEADSEENTENITEKDEKQKMKQPSALMHTLNIDMPKGLKAFKNQQELYDEAVDDFIYKYYYSITTIKEMMASRKYEDVLELIINIKNDASLLCALKLAQSAQTIENELKSKVLDNTSISMEHFFEDLEVTLKEIHKYRER